jgi:hypothetical protein
MSDLTRDFTKDNTIKWLKEAVLFFKLPREYIHLLRGKSLTELIPQLIFYFVIYTSSFIFYSVSSKGFVFADLVRPAILNYIIVIPNVLLYCLSAWLATRKPHFKESLIFLLSIPLFIGPIALLLNSLFLNYEDYKYRFIGSCLMGLVNFYSYFCYGFVLRGINWSGLKITLVNLLVINIIVFFTLQINYDKYGPGGGEDYDPILEEYMMIVSHLEFIDAFPDARVARVEKGKITTYYGVTTQWDADSVAIFDKEDSHYKEAILKNITSLKKVESTLKFRRNQIATATFLKYFNNVNEEINADFKDTVELNKIKDKRPFLVNSQPGIRFYACEIANKQINDGQYYIREYNNNIINSNRTSIYPSEIPELLVQFPARQLHRQYFLFSLHGKLPIYNEPLLPF